MAHTGMAHTGVTLSPTETQRLRKLLAHHIGPIAQLLINRALAEEFGADAVCARLAGHLPPTADRDAFLRAARLAFARKA